MITSASAHYTEALLRPVFDRGLWHRLDVEPPDHDDMHPEIVAEAFVNEGRWVVTCPCGGAQLASKTERRFFCVDCAGEAHGGLWVRVVFPTDATQIEAVLAERPARNRNWRPGETVAGLRAENRHLAVGP